MKDVIIITGLTAAIGVVVGSCSLKILGEAVPLDAMVIETIELRFLGFRYFHEREIGLNP